MMIYIYTTGGIMRPPRVQMMMKSQYNGENIVNSGWRNPLAREKKWMVSSNEKHDLVTMYTRDILNNL